MWPEEEINIKGAHSGRGSRGRSEGNCFISMVMLGGVVDVADDD